MALLRRALLAAFAVAFVVPFGGAVALASCAQLDLTAQIAGAEIIALGTVTETRQTFAAAGGVIKFRPERLLKGALTKEVQVYLGPTHGGNGVTSVDYTAVVRGERHTLYLRAFVDDGSYETNACSGSHAGVPTAEEEKLLGAGTAIDVPTEAALSPVTIAAIALVVAIAALAILRVFLGKRSV
jgi:hypothetical protein